MSSVRHPRSSLLTALLFGAALAAQDPEPDAGSVALHQACLDATTDALVLNVAAHPDDEADRTLVWLRHGHGLRTVSMYSTCGDGGQNAIGNEIGPELARIRVRETIAAAAHTGAEVRWLHFPDFGYSKSVEETLAHWGGAALLGKRMAAVLDELAPDVVFTNHDVKGGHGHHRASAVGIQAVLTARGAAAPPLYERVMDKDAQADWECDSFELDAARGATYARQASDGRHEHKTQGPWGRHDPTQPTHDRWRRVMPSDGSASADPLQSCGSVLREPAFAAVWSELDNDLDALARQLAAFGEERTAPEHVKAARALLPDLQEALQRLAAREGGAVAARRLARRVDALQRVILAGSGVSIEAYLPRARLLRGGTGTAIVVVHCAHAGRVSDVHASCRGAAGEAIVKDAPDRAQKIVFTLGATNGHGDDATLASAGDDDTEPEWVDVDVELAVDGMPLLVRRRLAAEPVPELDLAFGQETVFAAAGGTRERIVSLLARYEGPASFTGDVELEVPPGVRAELVPAHVVLSPEVPFAKVLVRLHIDPSEGAAAFPVRARLGSARADLRIVHTGIAVDPALRVGLVRGPDDTLQQVLEDLRIPCDVLDETELAVTDLSRFGTVVLDIRAYYHRPDLAQHRERLLQFCAAGGRIVAFYHKPSEWNERATHPLLAPFALEIGNDRVCEEDAVVTMLDAEHPLWHHPLSITPRDFDGWLQERGLNFPSKWADDWDPMLAMADAGEKPLLGGLLYSRVEKGDYLYCSLALYRQLRAGHVGAARLLMNLLTPSSSPETDHSSTQR